MIVQRSISNRSFGPGFESLHLHIIEGVRLRQTSLPLLGGDRLLTGLSKGTWRTIIANNWQRLPNEGSCLIKHLFSPCWQTMAIVCLPSGINKEILLNIKYANISPIP